MFILEAAEPTEEAESESRTGTRPISKIIAFKENKLPSPEGFLLEFKEVGSNVTHGPRLKLGTTPEDYPQSIYFFTGFAVNLKKISPSFELHFYPEIKQYCTLSKLT